MKIHELKTINPYFQDVWDNIKDFEVRINDRGFKVGDKVKLVEFGNCKYDRPRFIIKEIKYIFENCEYVKNGYIILGLKNVYTK